MSTAAVFDFDAINRRRNALVGSGPNGTVYAIDPLYRLKPMPDLAPVAGANVRLVETGHDWQEQLHRDVSICLRCGWEQPQCEQDDGMWTPPQVCAGKLQWGEACIACGQNTVATCDTPAGSATRCLSPGCLNEAWKRRDDARHAGREDRVLTRLQANHKAAQMAYTTALKAEVLAPIVSPLAYVADKALLDLMEAERMLAAYDHPNRVQRERKASQVFHDVLNSVMAGAVDRNKCFGIFGTPTS